MPQYDSQRPPRTPPHVSIRVVRIAARMTLEQACAGVTNELGLEKPMTRGALSAIEGGHRGASNEVLAALEVVYGLEPGDIVTDFAPRARAEIGVPA